MSATADSHRSRSAYRSSSSQGARKPGVCAPWPGATITSMGTLCPGEGHDPLSDPDEDCWSGFVETLQRLVRRCAVPEPADHERDAQDERLPGVAGGQAGEVENASKPVAHGVRVDIKRPSG